MKRWLLVMVLLLGPLLTLPSTIALAGNVDTYGIGAKAIALGGAFTAYADDPFAAYYNPAGLTQIKSPMISMGAEILDPTLKLPNYSAKDYNGNKVQPYDTELSDTSSDLVAPHFGFAIPTPGFNRLVFGFAVYSPYGLHIKWDNNPAVNPGAYNSFESYYIRVVANPTIAYKINDKLSVGFGVAIGRSYSGSQRRLYAPSMPNLNNRVIKGSFTDDTNYSFNFGIMYRPIKQLVLGAAYRSRTHTNFKGTVELVGVQKVDADTSIDHPDQVQVGVRYMPSDKVSVEADVVWTHWSVVDKYTIHFHQPFMGKTKETFPRSWKNTKRVRFGVEWKATKLLTLRAGYYYDPTPIPDDTFDLLWPDGDKKTYSLGAGLNFTKHLSLDIALQYTISEYTREIGGESSNLNSSYSNPVTGAPGSVSTKAKGHLWGYALTVNYKF